MKYILLAITALLLTACSPKYEIKTHYTPPTDKEGRVCIQNCEVKRETCQSHCNQKQNQCLSQTKEEVKKTFPLIMDEYGDIMHQYEAQMNRYDGEIASWDRKYTRLEQQFQTYRGMCNTAKNKNSYECRRTAEVDNELHSIKAIEPTPPPRPNKPSLFQEIKKAQKACSNKCGCQKSYENCFVSCGGKLTYEKFCVENCK
jgi:hypothetical protein